jgi:hypothetical protein
MIQEVGPFLLFHNSLHTTRFRQHTPPIPHTMVSSNDFSFRDVGSTSFLSVFS